MKFKYPKLSILLFLIFSLKAQAQESLCARMIKWDHSQQIDSLLYWRNQVHILSWQEVICLNRKLAKYHYRQHRDPQSAFLQLQYENDLIQKIETEADRTLCIRYFTDLGFYALKCEYFNQSLDQYEQAKMLFEERHTLSEDFLALYILTPIGNIHTRRGDYSKALIHLERANAILQRMGMMTQAAALFPNIGIVYYSTNQIQIALDTFIRAAQLIIDDPYALILAKINVATCYHKLGNTSETHRIIQEIDYLLRKYGDQISRSELSYFLVQRHLLSAGFHRDSEMYTLMKDDIKIVRTLIEQKKHKQASRISAKAFVNIGELLLHINESAEALKVTEMGFAAMLPQWESLPDKDFALPDSFYADNTFAEILDLRARALAQQHEAQPIESILSQSLTCYLRMFEVWDLLRDKYNYRSSHHFVLKENRHHIEIALETCYRLRTLYNKEGHANQIHELTQRAKNLLLQESVNQKNRTNIRDIPDSLRAQKHQIAASIAQLKTQLLKPDQAISSIENHILRDSLDRLLNKEKNLSKYIIQSYPNNETTRFSWTHLDDLQSILSPSQEVIEYFIGDSALYIFNYTHDTHQFTRQRTNRDCIKAIQQLRIGLLDYWYLPSDQRTTKKFEEFHNLYLTAAHSLHQILIYPITPVKKELIIIPDAALVHLPFEILLTRPHHTTDNFKTLNYLIRQHTISYNYAGTLWDSADESLSTFIGFAPIFQAESTLVSSTDDYRRNNLGPLQWNIEEIQSIAHLIGGKALTGENASLENFIKHASQTSILHLASHAKVDMTQSEFSYLAFSDIGQNESKLYLNDLSQYDLNTDMVVLSACETGLGDLFEGDGVASLARGFASAGARSVITSLWEVNDKSTSEIMISFYSELKQKKTKSEALRMAKLTYLDEQIENYSAHPFYWAGFVAIGDMSPLDFSSSISTAWIYPISALALGILFLIVLQRKRRQ